MVFPAGESARAGDKQVVVIALKAELAVGGDVDRVTLGRCGILLRSSILLTPKTLKT